jgi:CBS domain-containing protein
MALKDLRGGISVREVMSPTPISLPQKATVSEAARLMKEKEIGSLLVLNGGKTVGVVTERDLVMRVLAEKKDPEKTQVESIMSSPIMTVEPDVNIVDAIRKMSRLNIRRLVVMDKGRTAGVVTERDILKVAPDLMEVLGEAAAIRAPKTKGPEQLTGYCDRCEEWSDNLRQYEGEMICEACWLEETSETEEQ